MWDRLTSEEAVILVAEHLNRTQGSCSGSDHSVQTKEAAHIPKAELPLKEAFKSLMESDNASAPRPYPASDLPGSAARSNGNWTFKDDNAATHLVRNSIGDGDEKVRRQLMSAVGDAGVRDARDDVTAV